MLKCHGCLNKTCIMTTLQKRKGFSLAYRLQSFIEESQRMNSSQELETETTEDAAYWLTPSCLLIHNPVLPCLGMVPPTVGWGLPHRSQLRKCPTSLFTAQSYWSIFLNLVSSQVTLACVKWRKRSQHRRAALWAAGKWEWELAPTVHLQNSVLTQSLSLYSL